MVTALNTSSGVMAMYRQAMDMTKSKLAVGQDPGLKSVAKAKGNPAASIFRAGA